MLDSFLKYINQENLLEPKGKVLLGISGGIDSMVMLDLFQKASYQFCIAHCNFKLRGEESDADQAFVETFAKENKLTYFIKEFDTESYAQKNQISIQMAARQLRINWFKKLLRDQNLDYYATAHHLDDQAETFFINLMRSTGIAGLHGILPKQDKLIHPMLFTNRESINKYASTKNIKFREDSSNQSNKYLRNKIRHQLIPLLNDINPDFDKILAGNIEHIQQTEKIYRNEVRKVETRLLQKGENDVYKIEISKLKQLSESVLFLYEMISKFGFHYNDAEDMIKSIDSISGKRFYSASHRLIRDREFFIIHKMDPAKKNNPKFRIYDSQMVISTPIKLTFEKINLNNNFQISANSNIALIDYQLLSFPLTLRKWKEGDHFYPLGMQNKKLLSDFFIDLKLSIAEKENTWLLVNQDEIIWILGHRIDNRYKITTKTTRVLKVKLLQ
jgi:tRNA(Ile)-lysidine synthase